MNDKIQYTNQAKLKQGGSSEFNLIKKLQIGGTGSMKMIHLEGIKFADKFDSKSKSHHYLSFELRPNTLIGRVYGDETKTFLINKENILSIEFETYNLRIATKTGVVIRHEAIVQIKLEDQMIKLYLPGSVYKSVKKFFVKDWLKSKTSFSLNPLEPEVDHRALVADIITKLLE